MPVSPPPVLTRTMTRSIEFELPFELPELDHSRNGSPRGPEAENRVLFREVRSFGTARVTHGDAYELMPALEANSIDLLITSPPYWGHRTYEQDHNWKILDDWKREGYDETTV